MFVEKKKWLKIEKNEGKAQQHVIKIIVEMEGGYLLPNIRP